MNPEIKATCKKSSDGWLLLKLSHLYEAVVYRVPKDLQKINSCFPPKFIEALKSACRKKATINQVIFVFKLDDSVVRNFFLKNEKFCLFNLELVSDDLSTIQPNRKDLSKEIRRRVRNLTFDQYRDDPAVLI